MKRLISLLLIAAMMLCVVGCGDKKEKNIDLKEYTVIKTDNFEVDAAMYAFFLYDYVGSYSSYIYYYGYDTSVTLTEQTSMCAFDTSKTWFEYFCSMTNSMLDQCLAMATAAVDAGISLSDEDKKEIDDYLAELESYAADYGAESLDEFFEMYYVEGVDTETFRKCIELEQLAYLCSAHYSDILEGKEYTAEQLADYRDSHPETFLKIDYIYYNFFSDFAEDASDEEKEAAYAAAKKEAEDFLSKNSADVDTFKNAIVEDENSAYDEPYDADIILSDYIIEGENYDAEEASADENKDFYEWAFSTDRKAGDVYVRENSFTDGEKYYTVYFLETPVYIDSYVTKNVRHILFEVDTELEGDALEEAYNAALAEAEDVLEKYNEGEKNESAFAALAKEYTDDSNGDDGGLYKNVELDYMVEEFENWIYDESRYAGETEIIKTDYGYHIMYFVGDGLKAWESYAVSGIMDELYSEHIDELVETYHMEYDSEAIEKIP